MICTVLRSVMIYEVYDLDKKIEHLLMLYFLAEKPGFGERSAVSRRRATVSNYPAFWSIKKDEQGKAGVVFYVGGETGI